MDLDINEMSLDEIYNHVRSGLIDIGTFADYINGLLALGIDIGKKKSIEAIENTLKD